ncbi:MAG TPA: hypothetical protein VN836_11765 [Verrucomicrobiae bacterium]|nr:hypothetical protein [Verrucomicrobiae bacterium]
MTVLVAVESGTGILPVSLAGWKPAPLLTGFSVKEKDEASLSDGFRQDSLDAFILRFAGV